MLPLKKHFDTLTTAFLPPPPPLRLSTPTPPLPPLPLFLFHRQVLKIIHQYKHSTSIFDDFGHYEKRQEVETFREGDIAPASAPAKPGPPPPPPAAGGPNNPRK